MGMISNIDNFHLDRNGLNHLKIAFKGHGLSRETMAGFERKIERRSILTILLIGVFIGLGFGLLLLFSLSRGSNNFADRFRIAPIHHDSRSNHQLPYYISSLEDVVNPCSNINGDLI